MRFVHASNVKLNAEPRISAQEIKLQKERHDNFFTLLSYCEEHRIDALFLCGNLFSAEPTEADLRKVNQDFSHLSVTHVFWTVGNRESISPELLSNFPWTSNVTVFSPERIERVYSKRLDAEFMGIGYGTPYRMMDFSKLKGGTRGSLQVLLLPSGFENPEILDLPFDHVAIGGQRIIPNGINGNVYAAGDLTPRDSSEESKGGFLKGEISISNGHITTSVRFMENFHRKADTTSEDISFADKMDLIAMKDTSLSADSNDAIGLFLRDMDNAKDEECHKKAISYGVEALLSIRKEDKK